MENGLLKIKPDKKDYSLLHTFGTVSPDPDSLPGDFSIYDGQDIPNQNDMDTRFEPNLPPLPFGCTGESGAFDCGIQDKDLYDPKDLYDNTPPKWNGGRDIRAMFDTLITRGPRKADGTFGEKRLAYFNCYGSGAIDDFDAVRIALWINQWERRSVYVGTWWYWDTSENGVLEMPSFDIKNAGLHCYLATGWTTKNNKLYLETIPWLGKTFGDNGKVYLSREIYNALMKQPWTGAFTISKIPSNTPIPIGYKAIIDHLVYFVRDLFKISRTMPLEAPILPQETSTQQNEVNVPIHTKETLIWDTPKQAYHSYRVLCDELGATFEQKEKLCAMVYQESEFKRGVVGKLNKNGTRDYGLCQFNNGTIKGVPLWIGEGATFSSIEEVLNNPEKCARVMIKTCINEGHWNWWCSYSSGEYKKHLSPTSEMRILEMI